MEAVTNAPPCVSQDETKVAPRGTGESKTSGDKKCKYIIFPWGNSCGCFHDVFRERSDRWQEVSYEKVDVEHPRTWHANFVWKIRRQGISGYRTVEGPPPKGYGKNEGEELQILNYMPHFREIMTKVGLAAAAKKYAKIRQVDWPDFLPISIVINPFWQTDFEEGEHPLKSSQFQDFINIFRKSAKGNAAHMSNQCEKNMWLIKPAAANRGIGIEIFTKLNEVKSFLRDSERWKEHWIVQKYIEKPLLIEKRKFDIRCWLLIRGSRTSPGLEALMYKEWYVRLSTEEFSMDTNDRYVHLTNWSVQKKHPNFSQHEDGNTWSMDMFKNYIGASTKLNFDEINSSIENILQQTCNMVFTCRANGRGNSFPPVVEDKRRENYELLGYDFMVDEYGKVWMLEVNGNPSLSYQNKNHEGLVKRMIGDLIDTMSSNLPSIKTGANSSPSSFKTIFNSGTDCDELSTAPVVTEQKQKVEDDKKLPRLVPAHRFVEQEKKTRFPQATHVINPKQSKKKLTILEPPPKRKRLYKLKKKHVSVVERASEAAQMMYHEKLLELKEEDEEFEKRNHRVPYICSPSFVPPPRTQSRRHGKRIMSIGRHGQVGTHSTKVVPMSFYQVQRQRKPFLQFFETSKIRTFLQTKSAPPPIPENKWFKQQKARHTLNSPRPWENSKIVDRRGASEPAHGSRSTIVALDDSFSVPFRVSCINIQ